MATMDLSTNQEVMGVQSRYEYAHHLFKSKEAFEETDIQGKTNLFNTLKTEANSNHDHDSSSLFQVTCLNENKFEVDNALFSYSSFKKAMDLRTHNRTPDGVKRTIFDDAEYFAKHYRYKLLPITLEPVDETVIQVEHNYSLMSLNSESETEENCSRMMDYSKIKEKNYKRRKNKCADGSDEELLECDVLHSAIHGKNTEECQNVSTDVDMDDTVAVQPLDLSAAPLVQEKKTDSYLRESPSSIAETDEVAQLDSDKENVNSELNGILVTITRPDEKENYQPCDLFLNDIARLVPRLIDKDCVEVDIMDRTCDRHDEYRKHRLYYVISEATWRLFQKTNERVILTNDQSLGQPLRKVEKDERPSYLVFDQFSLAKCLADYCQEIGGCFEYTCVEEEKEEGHVKEIPKETLEKMTVDGRIVKEEKIVDVPQKEPKEEITEKVSPTADDIKDLVETVPEALTELKAPKEDSSELDESSQKAFIKSEEEKPTEKKVLPPESEEEKPTEKIVLPESEDEKPTETKVLPPESQKETPTDKIVLPKSEKETPTETTVLPPESEKEIPTEKTVLPPESDEEKPTETKVLPPESQKETPTDKIVLPKSEKETPTETKVLPPESQKETPTEKTVLPPESDEEKPTEKTVLPPESEENAPEKGDETKQKPPDEEMKEKETKIPEQTSPEAGGNKNKDKVTKQTKGTKRKRKSSIQRKPKNSRPTSRTKSTSELETSQKSDKPVNRKGRREATTLSKEEPPNKVSKPSVPEEEPSRKTRSGKVLQEVKTNKPTTKKRERVGPGRNAVQKKAKEEEKKTEETGRNLRSHKAPQWKEKVQVRSKANGRKR